jgi:hypothetical protein
MSPAAGASITKLPFTVNLGVDGDFNKIDISLDGQVVATLNNGNLQAQIGQKLADGNHTLSAKVTYNNGSSASNSIQVKYALDGGLVLTSPEEGDTISFPWKLQAESPNSLSGVSFYYQSGNVIKTIGSAQASGSNGNYRYTYTWSDQPKSGTYKVFAKSSNGTTSAKVTFTIE